LTKRWLPCCLGVAVLLSGCATAEKRPTVGRVPTPPPPLQTLPLRTTDRIIPPELASIPDAAEVLIKQVENLYSAGMRDYRSGNLEKAKEEFDQALSTLLVSDLNIQGDERLRSEFDNVVENVYAAEAASLEHGDSLRPRNYEPAPLDSFSGLTFPVDPRVKEQAQEELKSVQSDLPLVSNDYVDGVLTYLQKRGRGYMEAVLKRGGMYQQIIGDALRKEGLPQDLIYLAAGESAFNPFAVSRARCVGIWQFALGTGVLYGLKKDRWVDERSDPIKSSAAAAQHLKDLYQTFGDWFLAMAAYDSGALMVQRAIERTGYADYWTLRRLHALPAETENYVPVFLATTMIAKDPKAFGFDSQPDPPLAPDKVTAETPVDLRLIAQLIDRPVEDLINLNPSLLRWTTPGNDPEFVLNLPPGTKDLYENNIAAIPPDKRIWWRAHKVAEGETLAGIAKQFRISPLALAEVNQLRPGASLEGGAHLVVPMAPGTDSSLVRVRERGPRRLLRYRVRPGDTLDLVADRFDVTPYQLRRWNNLKSSQLAPGRYLRLYVRAEERSTSRASHPKRNTKAGQASPAKNPASSKAPLANQKPPASRTPSAPAAALPVQ
jgi:membrane-bound lytic murein transglycosylase D